MPIADAHEQRLLIPTPTVKAIAPSFSDHDLHPNAHAREMSIHCS